MICMLLICVILIDLQKKEELYGDNAIDRAIMWKKARTTKDGHTDNEDLKTAFQKIVCDLF